MSDWVTVVEKPRNTHKPWAVRWRVGGETHEKSFASRKEAETYKHELLYRLGSGRWVDPAKSTQVFREAAESWFTSEPRTTNTLRNYRSVLKQHINPVFGDVPMEKLARDVVGVRTFLLKTLPDKGVSASTVRTAKMIITGTVRDAIATGRLTRSAGAIIFGKGIKIPPVPTKADIYFASHAELEKLAEGLGEPWGLLVWITRGTGIRLGEALAVKREDFQDGILRITEQYTAQRKYAPLKHRQAGQWRDVPYPTYLEAMLPDAKGYIFTEPPNRTTLRRRFNKARDAAGLPKSFTWHSLRHIFVSVMLSENIPITDVSRWLGHASIHTTAAIYGHMVPRAMPRGRAALDWEYETWHQES